MAIGPCVKPPPYGHRAGVATGRLDFARDVHADQYGIRTIVSSNGAGLKFEIVREAPTATRFHARSGR